MVVGAVGLFVVLDPRTPVWLMERATDVWAAIAGIVAAVLAAIRSLFGGS